MFCLLLIAASPMLAGSWSLDYPNNNTYVSKTNAIGTGNAAVNETFTYRILKKSGALNGQISSSTSTGGWMEYIPGPMQTGQGNKAQLLDSQGTVKASADPVEVKP